MGIIDRICGSAGRARSGSFDFVKSDMRSGLFRGLGFDGRKAATRAGRGKRTGDGRPDNPSRCALPITAFRVVASPSAAAIWLAVNPSVQSLVNRAMRSSVQAMISPSFRTPKETGNAVILPENAG
jgi:hypothetical protein